MQLEVAWATSLPASSTKRKYPLSLNLQIAHVFNDSQNGHLQPIEQLNSLPYIQQSNFLRGSDNQRPSQRYLLSKRKLDVPGSRRKVDEKKI